MIKRTDLGKIEDKYIREALELIYSEIDSNQQILRGNWSFRTITVEGSGTHSFKHNLGFIPSDVILLSYNGAAPTFNYSSFDKDNISLTTSGDSTIRCFLGKYAEK
jgi:hypothetical protein